jgi:hypothetical protein
MRGEALPSRRRGYRRIVRRVSEEADATLTLLERAPERQRSLRSFRDTFVSGFAEEAAAELVELGLAEFVGGGDARAARLTPEAEGVVLLASWSRREGTGRREDTGDRPGAA